MKSDIEIARTTELKKIKQVAEEIGIPRDEVENYGRYIAKIPDHLIDDEKAKKSNLILVTAITATKAGIGKPPFPSVWRWDSTRLARKPLWHCVNPLWALASA